MSEQAWEEVTVDGETARKLWGLTKRQLIEKLVQAALEAETAKLRCKTAVEAEREAQRETEHVARQLKEARDRLALAEGYVEQGRAMVTAVMDRWYEYDV